VDTNVSVPDHLDDRACFRRLNTTLGNLDLIEITLALPGAASTLTGLTTLTGYPGQGGQGGRANPTCSQIPLADRR
jgi:hypothetical protein